MTQRRRAPRRRKKIRRRVFLAGLGGAALATGAYIVHHSIQNRNEPKSPTAPDAAPEPNPALPSGEWRAVWVSYLEWARMDFSSEEAFRTAAAELLDNCAALGLNTVIAQVRPFGDALYESSLFPWSHLCTGTQGQGPGFDPLDVLVTEAHGRGLSLEAWVNPYRLKSSAAMPPSIADTNLMNTHPEWCCTVGDGVYLNPAVPEAAAYVVQGVAELVEKYAVDGIHFDDYFYPTTDASLDAAQFAASGEADLADWRRANVTALVKGARDAVKAADPTLRFGISPQGNRFAFENIVPEWLGMARAANVALYFGLGAYRVGVGDGGANEDSTSQWATGSALARQVADLRRWGAQGWALYRYDSLFGPAQNDLAAAERAALAEGNG